MAAVLLGAIVVTGATVRLTSSGLGCPTWPKCTDTSLVAPARYHALVEFTNRIITILVGVFVGLVALASLLRAERRADLTWLAWSLVAGFCGQAVIGGLSVLYRLAPPWVMAHFLLSMLLMWAALVLVHRANPAWRPTQPKVRRELLLLGRLLVVVAGCVLILGTITTGAGPHAGSGAHVQRLHISLLRITQLHADSALLLTGLIVATVVAIRISDAPPTVRRRSYWLVGAVVTQVAIGYTQYFLNLPPSVVELHVAGATVLWSTTVWLQLGYTAPTRQTGGMAPAPSPAETAPADGVGASERRAALSLASPTAAASVGWPKVDTPARPRAVEIEGTPDPGTDQPY
ncbi:MAG TPA: COX15/CtaA family protein [Nocardioidaceae bacterium]|nr:COX15/CtaA family protein [Nocardioidaceae bacterium]